MRTFFSLAILNFSISFCIGQNAPAVIHRSLSSLPPSELEDQNYYLRNEQEADSIFQSFLLQVNSVRELMNVLPTFADSVYYWTWDENTAGWLVIRKTINFPNEEENNIVTLGYDWNGTEWVKTTRHTAYYKDPGGLSRQIYEKWDGTGYIRTTQSTYDFDPVKNQRLSTDQKWNNSQWENTSNHLTSYNDNNQLSHYIIKKWQSGSWVNQREVYNFYDTTTLVQQISTYDWAGEWILSFDQFYTYDTTKKTIITYKFVDTLGLVPLSMNISEYDSSGNQLTSLSRVYKEDTWRNSVRHFYEYNHFGSQVYSLTQRFSNLDTWENDRQSFDGYDSLQQRIYSVDKDWDNGWIYTDSVYYYRSHQITSAKDLPQSHFDLKVYPNPSIDKISLDLPENMQGPFVIRLFSATGLIVLEKSSSDFVTKHLDVSSIPPGMYYMQICFGQSIATQRVTKI